MFPNDLYITDPHNNQLWKIVNGTNQELVGLTDSDPRAVCVSQDKISVFVANKNSNTLSIFRNGERVSSNYVGNAPSAVCEDLDGNIYVCCYLSNSVIKLDKGGKQIATIMVDPGPYGICCDSTGTIWVSCFLSNKVDKIVNNQKVDSIAVANNPQGICCDPMDGVWVACYGSNVVDYIYKSNKILDIQVGKSPVAITSTSQGVIYVCNYNGRNVTKISKILNDGSTTQYHIETELIDVGLNPNSISVDQYDTVYVTNSGENSISVISDNITISSIETVFSPTGYGDFTGCQLYNSINRNISSGGSGGGSGEVPEGGWTINDLSKEIQQAINLVIGKEVETSAEFVKYNHSEYTNVKLALDFLIENYDSIGDSFQDDIDSINSIIEQIKTKNTQQDNSISDLQSLYDELKTSLSTLTQKVTDIQNNMTIFQSNTNDRLDGIESDIESIRDSIPPDVSDFSEAIQDLQDKFTGEQANSALDSDKLGGKDPSYYASTEQLNSAMDNLYASNILVFNNVEDMKISNKIKNGYTIKTLGFYEPNDGGGADYLITNDIGENEIDEASIISLQNNLYAKLIVKDYVNVKWFGAKGDGETDDTEAIQNVFDYCVSIGSKVFFPKSIYSVSKVIYNSTSSSPNSPYIDFNFSTLKANTENDAVFEINSENYDGVNKEFRGGKIVNIKIDCNNTSSLGLLISKATNYTIDTINIINIKDTGYAHMSGSGVTLQNAYASAFSSNNYTTGFKIHSDSVYKNIGTENITVAIDEYNPGGRIDIINLHSYYSKIPDSVDIFKKSCCIKSYNNTNILASHVICDAINSLFYLEDSNISIAGSNLDIHNAINPTQYEEYADENCTQYLFKYSDEADLTNTNKQVVSNLIYYCFSGITDTQKISNIGEDFKGTVTGLTLKLDNVNLLMSIPSFCNTGVNPDYINQNETDFTNTNDLELTTSYVTSSSGKQYINTSKSVGVKFKNIFNNSSKDIKFKDYKSVMEITSGTETTYAHINIKESRDFGSVIEELINRNLYFASKFYSTIDSHFSLTVYLEEPEGKNSKIVSSGNTYFIKANVAKGWIFNVSIDKNLIYDFINSYDEPITPLIRYEFNYEIPVNGKLYIKNFGIYSANSPYYVIR